MAKPPPDMGGAGRVVVVGSFNVDHAWHPEALPRPGETVAGHYATGPGGKGFNQAVAAARAGAATTFVCALGDDDGGALARSLARDEGIELHAAKGCRPTGTAGIFVDAGGRNSIVVGAGANAELDAAFLDTHAAAFDGAAVVLVQLESPCETVLAALRHGRAAGAATVLNPAPAGLTPGERDALLAQVDVLTPNESEFASLLGPGADVDADAVAGIDDAALHALCRRLLPHGTVVVTLGAAGAFVSHGDAALHGDAEACYRVPAGDAAVVDTTGAGDAFNGALAAGLSRDPGRFGEGVRFAARFAALSTERKGAASAMPTLDEVEERYREL